MTDDNDWTALERLMVSGDKVSETLTRLTTCAANRRRLDFNYEVYNTPRETQCSAVFYLCYTLLAMANVLKPVAHGLRLDPSQLEQLQQVMAHYGDEPNTVWDVGTITIIMNCIQLGDLESAGQMFGVAAGSPQSIQNMLWILLHSAKHYSEMPAPLSHRDLELRTATLRGALVIVRNITQEAPWCDECLSYAHRIMATTDDTHAEPPGDTWIGDNPEGGNPR